MKQLLLSILFSKTDREFTSNLAELLQSREFDSFTVWEITGGAMCRPVDGRKGITEGTFDIYDLGWDGNAIHRKSFVVSDFGAEFTVEAGLFCAAGEMLRYGVTFHREISADAYTWLSALLPLLNNRVEELTAEERRMDIFVDYQRKIDFIKESGQILKLLSVNEVVVNALNYFTSTFQSDAGCAIFKDQFTGFGISADDLDNAFFVKGVPLKEYMTTITETEFIHEEVESPRFTLLNLFIVVEPLSGAIFLLFNIVVDKVPDKEFSALISHIVSIAMENASYHERMTKFMVEEAEMSQTVSILNQFVKRELSMEEPELFAANYPAKSTGGDFFTIIEKDGYMFICVADVCGKGYSAAVFTVMLAAMMNSAVFDDLRNLPDITYHINNYLLSNNFDDRFITAFLCVYDKGKKSLSYLGCGHEPIYLMKGDGAVLSLKSGNLPMGLMAEEYKTEEVPLDKGDRVFIYTDGVVEYISYEGLAEKLGALSDATPSELVKTLYTMLVENPEEQKDDFTCIAIRF